MGDTEDVASRLLEPVRAICLGFPDAYEQRAWVGTRWRVRQRTFAHVLPIAAGRPPAYARAAGTDGPATVLTFRSAPPELDVLARAGYPFFRPPWGPDVVGIVLAGAADRDVDRHVDWDEVRELLTESYCASAPKRLVARVDRPLE